MIIVVQTNCYKELPARSSDKTDRRSGIRKKQKLMRDHVSMKLQKYERSY